MIEKIYMRPEKIPTSNRGLEKYLSDLNLTKETLEDKRILDLGSGTRRFAKELEDGGVKAEIFSLDPIFENPKEKIEAGAEELSEQLSKTRRVQNTVAGLGEHLPFKNNSFDLILAEYSLPAHATSKKQIDDFFESSLSSLRVGGKLRFCPPVSLQNPVLSEYITNKITELSNTSMYEVTKSDHITIIKKLK